MDTPNPSEAIERLSALFDKLIREGRYQDAGVLSYAIAAFGITDLGDQDAR